MIKSFRRGLFLSLLIFLLPGVSCQTQSFPGLGAPVPDGTTSLISQDQEWFKDSVFYHVWIKAFADSNGDGIGDIPGLTGKLDYLSQDLGITALWLSPHMTNASTLPNLHGYDVTDHYSVDPRFGTNDQMKTFLQEAHKRGIRVIFDLVPNHVSDKHPWFQEALADQNGKRSWFKFRDSRPATGWTGFDRTSDWHRGTGGSYYYGIFWKGMPDLNYRNPEVRKEIAQVARFWLDMGFDGLRIDAVRYLFENEESSGAKDDTTDLPETISFFQDFRKQVIDPYTSLHYPKMMVAENWTDNKAGLKSYLGTLENPSFQMTFDFPSVRMITQKAEDPTNYDLDDWWQDFSTKLTVGWMGTFLSNHDNVISRPATRYEGDKNLQRSAAALQLTGPGTPFIYYGNEIGMEGEAGNDINLRTDFEWDRLEQEQKDRESLFHSYSALISLRKSQPALSRGDFSIVPTAEEALFAFTRQWKNQTLLVIHNLSQDAVSPDSILQAKAIQKQIFGKPGFLPSKDVGVWLLK